VVWPRAEVNPGGPRPVGGSARPEHAARRITPVRSSPKTECYRRLRKTTSQTGELIPQFPSSAS
jgi:hypothetical protein